ncbi:MAG: hypothetical protein IJP42_08265 [Selenomonadaceae bacterium]|nr:hypothetical protein [Selenomonadaceae bacterium]MBQ6759052.1 hypothetical protein [Selenomonadaceae bacterium]MBR0103148.1 hypothetical protein [Selenomonadaceae bacterium]
MGIWEINSSPLLDVSNPTFKANSKGVASEYSKILAEKMANAKADLEQMEAVQEQLDEIDELHEELTGNASTQMVEVETIKRFMPDGSIMVTTYEDGKITEQVRHKPPMMVVPDYTAPPTPDGSPATELKPYQNFDLMMLLSM